MECGVGLTPSIAKECVPIGKDTGPMTDDNHI